MNAIRRITTAAVGVMALATATNLVAAANASHAIPGQVCLTNQNTWVRDSPGGKVLYTIEAGHGFRYTRDENVFWVVGNGNGHSDGYAPAGNISWWTCTGP